MHEALLRPHIREMENMDRLTCEIKDFARSVGADLVGIAGKACFSEIPFVRPDQLLPEARSVVVMAKRVSPYAIPSGNSWHAQEFYMGSLALQMHILMRTADFIEDKGFEAFPVSPHGYFRTHDAHTREAAKHLSISADGEVQGVEAFHKTFKEQLKCLPHTRLAEEAGLGEIGRCRQLLTPEYGPRVELFSIVTEAHLEPDEKLTEPICLKDECNKCVEACRSGALTPYGYNMVKCMFQMSSLPHPDVIKRKDQEAMDRHFNAAKIMVFPFERAIVQQFKATGPLSKGGGCGMCVIACPIGRKHGARPRPNLGRPSVTAGVY